MNLKNLLFCKQCPLAGPRGNEQRVAMTAQQLRSKFIQGPQGYPGWTGPQGRAGATGMTGTIHKTRVNGKSVAEIKQKLTY